MSFINRLFNAFSQVPEFCRDVMVGKYMVPALVFIILFLVVIFFTSKVVNVLRRIFIAAALVLGVIGYFRNNYALIWVNLIALVVLGIARLLRHIFVTVQQDRANARIEAKALAKARKRRGAWENKQAYSGDTRPINFDAETAPSDSSDPRDSESAQPSSQNGDASEAKGTPAASSDQDKKAADPSLQQTTQIPIIPEEENDESYGNREQIMETIHQLKDLKDKGVLTEEEYNKKKAELYSRMG